MSTTEELPSIAANRSLEPKKLSGLVYGELDWIVMKSLEKDRNRRYETANGLARDVENYLHDEPVQACPPSAGYRFRKFVRRSKRALTMAALLGAMLLVAVGAVTGIIGWAVRDREAREQELAREAERKRALTAQGVRQALGQGGKIRAELHAGLASPGGVQALLNQPTRWDFSIKSAQSELAQARRLTARAEGRLEAESTQAMDKLEEQLTGDDADRLLALRLEKIRLDRATVVEGKFKNRKAAEEYANAFAGFAILKEDPAAVAVRFRSSPIKEQLVAALDDWAWVAFKLRNEGLAERLLAVARQTAPDPAWGDRLRHLNIWRDQEALRKLVEAAPAARSSPQMLALVGNLLRDRTSLQESWLRRAQAEYPADFWLNFNLANALRKTDPAESAGYWRVALAVRPGTSAAYYNLGIALDGQQKLPEAIAAYRKAIDLDPKFAVAYHNLGVALRGQQKLPEAIAACHKAIDLDPNFALAYHGLGTALHKQQKLPEAIAAYHKAIELDPKLTVAYNNLGVALSDQQKLPEAIAAFHKAIDLDPKDAARAYFNLGNALSDQQELPDAIAAYRKAIELDPKYAPAYYNLGAALRAQQKLPDAIAAFHKAIEVDPKCALAYHGLGAALRDQRKLPDAIAAYHKAIELDPNFALAYHGLGTVLRAQKKLPEAIAAYKRAIELAPNQALAHSNLGHALKAQGDFPEALLALQKGHELGTRTPGWSYPSATWVKECTTLLALDQKLPAVLQGKAAGAREYLNLAYLCLRYKKRYRDAVVLFGKGFAAEPKFADDLQRFYRYNAACAAALTGCGQGEDTGQLDDKERARLRQQALDWLRADLVAWQKQWQKEPDKARPVVQRTLRHWRQAVEFAGLRGADALARLPDVEGEAWQQLWHQVETLVRRTAEPKK